MTGLDRWIFDAFAKLDPDVRAAFDKCEFHIAYQRITQFVPVELSAIYHDTVKDRLYTSPANSTRGRSTQTTLYRLVKGLRQDALPDDRVHRRRGMGGHPAP
ncbi:MAG: hypothetical protein Ct9H300mP7_4640 [Verrucomicrobiota bacterium]|nr:MAG: hypothetical protein Ct9H300mP7_4640 [Verrucomicrobiota bacterium]